MMMMMMMIYIYIYIAMKKMGMCFSDQSNVFQRTVLFFEIKTVLFLVQYNPRNSERMCDEHHSQDIGMSIKEQKKT